MPRRHPRDMACKVSNKIASTVAARIWGLRPRPGNPPTGHSRFREPVAPAPHRVLVRAQRLDTGINHRGVGLDGPAGPSLARLNRLDRIDRADRAGAPPLVLGRAAGDGQTLPVSGFVVRYPVTTAPRRSCPQGQPRFSELSRGSADGCQTQTSCRGLL